MDKKENKSYANEMRGKRALGGLLTMKCRLKKRAAEGVGILRRCFSGEFWLRKSAGIDGILVTVGLCIIALLLCVVMKDKLAVLLENVISAMSNKASGILNGV